MVTVSKHPMAAYREAKSLSQETLGAQIGVTGMTVSRWERGMLLPRRSQWASIKRVTKLTMDDFVPHVREVAA